MDIEQKQADLIDQFVKQASSLHGSALAPLVADATSHPSLFAFSEILSVPSVLQVRLMYSEFDWIATGKKKKFKFVRYVITNGFSFLLLLFDISISIWNWKVHYLVKKRRKEGILKCFYVGKLYMGNIYIYIYTQSLMCSILGYRIN